MSNAKGAKPYDDPDEIHRLYHGERMTQKEVAAELGCSKATIISRMDEYDIPTLDPGGGDPNAPWKDEDTLREMYHDDRMYLTEIGDELGADEATIRHWMDNFDIERVPMGTRVRPPSVWTDTCGYEVVEPDGDRAPIHRLVAVAEYGFDAVADNDVHHRNNVPWDNRPSNLEPIDHADHARHHAHESKFWEHRENVSGVNNG